VVGARAKKLGIVCEQAIPDKAEAVRRLASERGLALNACAFVGNDINDIPALSLCGLAISVADAWPEIWSHLDLVTSRPGELGAVREICDALVSARQNIPKKGSKHIG
jgi:3-deoxy-D-manno-octulosonate 8-phosphate phosphatase KdsC-like HAD superfamily phosphatase